VSRQAPGRDDKSAGEIRLTRLGPEGAAAVAAVLAHCFEAPWSAASCRGTLASPGAFALLAERGTEAAGVAVVLVAAGSADLLTLGVAPPHRRRGVGSVLLKAVLVHAGASGAREIVLEVEDGNHAAIALYTRNAFGEIARRRNYYLSADGKRPDAIVMRAGIGIVA
jgi:[ribosomal protein S18]-alanine N-acetyltransferase